MSSINSKNMKRVIVATSFLMLFVSNSKAQSKIGEVACVYMTSTDLDSSGLLFEKLGFYRVGSNTFPAPWLQVSDGSLLIMIRKDATPFMGLTYYSSDVDTIAAELEKEGIIFSQKPKEGDPIKRFYIKSPDGFSIVLSNNLGGFVQPNGTNLLSMKPEDYSSAEKFPNKQSGVFGEYCHPVADLTSSIAFWKKLGFRTSAIMKEPYPHAILSDGLMIIGLHQTKNFSSPAITYFGLDTEKRIEQLKSKGIKNFAEVAGKNNQSLRTWEGQLFFLFSLGM